MTTDSTLRADLAPTPSGVAVERLEELATEIEGLIDAHFDAAYAEGADGLRGREMIGPKISKIRSDISERLDLLTHSNMAVIRSAVEASQSILAEYIVPDSGITDRECVNRLLGILDHQDLVRALLRSSEAVSRDGWQTMETAPRDGTRVDLWAQGRRWANSRYLKAGEIIDWDRWQVYDQDSRTVMLPVNPSHYDAPKYWRPLPAAPTPQDEGTGE